LPSIKLSEFLIPQILSKRG